MNWGQIDNYHQRAKVPGGWLVKAFENAARTTIDGGITDGFNWYVAMCFVPDPNYEWKIEE